MPKHTPGEQRSNNDPQGGSPPEDVTNHADVITEMTAGPMEMREMMKAARDRRGTSKTDSE